MCGFWVVLGLFVGSEIGRNFADDFTEIFDVTGGNYIVVTGWPVRGVLFQGDETGFEFATHIGDMGLPGMAAFILKYAQVPQGRLRRGVFATE